MHPASKWLALTIGLALFGYAIFAFEYYSIANRYRELVQNNTTYIELERLVRDASASHKYALLAAAQAATLPEETVKSSASEFIEAARLAAKSNTIPALESYFEPILSGAAVMQDAISKPGVEVGKLRQGINDAGDRLPILVSITGEGRAAELRNLGDESDLPNLWPLLAILAAYVLLVVAVGVLAAINIRRIVTGTTAAATAHAGHPAQTDRSLYAGRFGEPTHATIVGVVVVALGFLLVANRERLLHAFPAFDTVAPDAGIKAAYDAYEADDIETALRLARRLAEQDNPRAQNLLGLIYVLGRGVPRDQAEAQRWFRRATDLGDPDAPAHIARMHYDGRGVPQDFAEAARWYRLAADRNNPRAQFNLGIMHWNGNGVPQDKINAHLWFNLAATRFSEDDPQGRTRAINNRDLLARSMTREEIAEAQKRAREWRPG